MASLTNFLKHPFDILERQAIEEEEEKARLKREEQKANDRVDSRTQHRNDEWDLQHRVYEDANLPALIDRGPLSGWQAKGDDVYWNSVLIQGEKGNERCRPKGCPGYDLLRRGGRTIGEGGGNNEIEQDGSEKKIYKGKEKAEEPPEEQTQRTSTTRKTPTAQGTPTKIRAPPKIPYTESSASLDSGCSSQQRWNYNYNSTHSSLKPDPLQIHRKNNRVHTSAGLSHSYHYKQDKMDSDRSPYQNCLRSSPTLGRSVDRHQHQHFDLEESNLTPPLRPRTSIPEAVSSSFAEMSLLPTDGTILVPGSPGHRRRVVAQEENYNGKPLQPSPSLSLPPSSFSFPRALRSQQPQQNPSLVNSQRSPILSTRLPCPNHHLRSTSTSSSFYSVPSLSCPSIKLENDPLTWNKTLNLVINNETIDPAMASAVRERAGDNGKTNGYGSNSQVSAINVGMVPNFSYPAVGARWCDKWVPMDETGLRGGANYWDGDRSSQDKVLGRPKKRLSEEFNEDEGLESLETSSHTSRESKEHLVNGTSSNASPTSSLLGETNGSLLSPLFQQVQLYHQESSNDPSHSESQKIDGLQRKINNCQQRKEFYKTHLIKHIENWGACKEHALELEEDNNVLRKELIGLREENAALWDTLQYSKAVLKLSFERENAVLDMLWDFKERQVDREEKTERSLRGILGGGKIASSFQSRNFKASGNGRVRRSNSHHSHQSSVATILSRFSRRPSLASICSHFSFYKRDEAQPMTHYGPCTSEFCSIPRSPSPNNSQISLRSALQTRPLSCARTITIASSKIVDSHQTQKKSTRNTRYDSEGRQIPKETKREYALPTVIQEVKAMISFADLHIRKLVEDIRDFGEREEKCWELREQKVQKDCESEMGFGLREALRMGSDVMDENRKESRDVRNV